MTNQQEISYLYQMLTATDEKDYNRIGAILRKVSSILGLEWIKKQIKEIME